MAAKGGETAKPDAAKPGLTIDPDTKAVFTGKFGAAAANRVPVVRYLTNTGPHRLTYKVMCRFEGARVRQPLGFIESKEKIKLELTYAGSTVPSSTNSHYFVVYYKKSVKEEDGDKSPRQIWTNDTTADGSIRREVEFNMIESTVETQDISRPNSIATEDFD